MWLIFQADENQGILKVSMTYCMKKLSTPARQRARKANHKENFVADLKFSKLFRSKLITFLNLESWMHSTGGFFVRVPNFELFWFLK